MIRILLCCIFMLTISKLYAQTADTVKMRPLTVINLETHVPLRDVHVFADQDSAVLTNYRGRCFIPAKFTRLVLRHSGFLTATLFPAEVGDTVVMLPNGTGLHEVTVWGKRSVLINNLEKSATKDLSQYEPKSSGLVVQFDLGKMLDRRGARDSKHREQAKKLLKKWDEAEVPHTTTGK